MSAAEEETGQRGSLAVSAKILRRVTETRRAEADRLTRRMRSAREGEHQAPGVAGTSGDIATAGLYAGGLGYGSMLEDDDASPPFTEKWRIHNWRNSLVFPAAPYDGHLYYRVTVDAECHIYQAPVFSGSVRELALPPAATIDCRAYDKIECRVEPTWRVKAVGERLQLAG